MKQVFIFSLLTVFLFSSCKKELESCPDPVDISTFDTIISDEWISAYPGSWWVYSNGYSDTCQLVEYDYYLLIEESSCNATEKNTIYVPEMFGVHYYQDQRLVSTNGFLNEISSKRSVLGFMVPWGNFQNPDNVSANPISYYGLDSIEVSGNYYTDVMIYNVSKHYDYDSGINSVTIHDTYLYAKEVGFIGGSFGNYAPYPLTSNFSVTLENYFIAPH